MPLTAGVHRISGVVADVMRDSVVIQCILASETVDLRLPPALVPKNLMSFGTPVWISLETTGGIRTPVIELRRPPIDSQPRMDGQDAIEDWLNST
jgi:hypothetical protein